MKKIFCILIAIALLFTSADTAFAKKKDADKKNNHKKNHHEYKDTEEEEKEYKIDDLPVIKYGEYIIPINPIAHGMDAKITFDKTTAEVKVVKGDTTIIINFKKEIVTINSVSDENSGIFTAKWYNKTIVLIKYIAYALGARIDIDDEEIIVGPPSIDLPTNIVITPVGTVVTANTLNTTTLYMNATAKIVAGIATGQRAELYVGSKLVATDSYISATDTEVNFTTSDGTPTNAELQAIVPKSGVVTVKLYKTNNSILTSAVANPTLLVDYLVPTLTGITSATYEAASSQLKLNVTGAGAVGDKVDVTKISFYDYISGRSYQLTNVSTTGSSGTINSNNLLTINIGTVDKQGISSIIGSSYYLNVAIGSLLKDAAGNSSNEIVTVIIVPVTTMSGLDLPTKVTVSPIGTTVIANTLNSTIICMNTTAKIIAGQATGGKAELYVGTKLVAVDGYITATDTEVNFTTSDGSPTNSELQTAIPAGGVVTVKLYNIYNNVVTSAVANPTLVVDYVAPAITGINYAIYDVSDNQIYFVTTNASPVGDKVEVTKISLFDSTLGRTYQLTNATGTGSTGIVNSTSSFTINIGSIDKLGLSGYGTTTVSLYIAVGSLLFDAAGNRSPEFSYIQTIPVTVIK